MSNWILTKLLSTSFFYKYEIILNSKIFVLLSKFLNKNINFKKNDLAILGPWSEIYFHKLNDFILRVIYAESFKRQLILPISLKKTIDQAPFNKIFKNIKFGYISNQNQKLSNLTLLSHIQHNKKNIYFKNSVVKLKNKMDKYYPIKKTDLFTLVSRSKSHRKLLNESELLKLLKKYNFKVYHFENLSLLNQINIIRKSKILIGYQGSNLANCIFLKKNNHLIDIFHPKINNPVYKIQSDMLGIKYHPTQCLKSLENLDGYCDIDKIEKIISKIIN